MAKVLSFVYLNMRGRREGERGCGVTITRTETDFMHRFYILGDFVSMIFFAFVAWKFRGNLTGELKKSEKTS
jgi:hypothetical protein